MNEDKIIRTMRLQTWERAKGELRALLQTYWGNDPKFLPMDTEVNKFVDKIESHGLVE